MGTEGLMGFSKKKATYREFTLACPEAKIQSNDVPMNVFFCYVKPLILAKELSYLMAQDSRSSLAQTVFGPAPRRQISLTYQVTKIPQYGHRGERLICFCIYI